jgi:hypothetical protein
MNETISFNNSLVERDNYISALEQTLYLRREIFRQHLTLSESNNMLIYHIDIFSQNKNYVEIAGWAYIKDNTSENCKIHIILKSDNSSFMFETRPIKRMDVTYYFKTLNYDDSGFSALIPNVVLESGEYRVGIYIKKDDVKALQFTDKTVAVKYRKDISIPEMELLELVRDNLPTITLEQNSFDEAKVFKNPGYFRREKQDSRKQRQKTLNRGITCY